MPKGKSKGGSARNSRTNPATVVPKPLLEISIAHDSLTSNEIDSSTMMVSPCNFETNEWDQKKETNHSIATASSSTEMNVQQQQQQFSLSKIDFQNVDHHIDLSQLSSTIHDLITGKHDQEAYEDFLSILKQYSVRSSRHDHFEASVYYLIQAAVSFIRVNEMRFDQEKLNECYRQRHQLRTMPSS